MFIIRESNFKIKKINKKLINFIPNMPRMSEKTTANFKLDSVVKEIFSSTKKKKNLT